MEFNRDTINKIRGLILFTVVTVIVGINYTRVLELLASAVHKAAPFILGAVIAFILNVPCAGLRQAWIGCLKRTAA